MVVTTESRVCLTSLVLVAIGCTPQPPAPEDDLVARGRNLFFNETFEGNGRTCGTCHRAEENFTLTREFIAGLPDDDPLFVAEFIPALSQNFENPVLMRNLGLIVENQDGFDDLANNFNMRGIPHTLGMRVSVESAAGPRTGWSGDGAPGDGSLRSFATGAVIQHFTLTTNRIPGVDFRLPTDEELDAMEAFQLSLGRQDELSLPLSLNGPIPARGQELFMSRAEGKCNACHFNAGANGDPALFAGAGNLNFDTGVEDLPDQPGDLFGQLNPPDDGFGVPGDGTFNVPSLVESADTGPFFHNNAVETIEGAVAFYNGDAFTNSPAGQLIIGATGSGINLDATQVVEVAAFLRVINALENIRQAIEMLESSNLGRFGSAAQDLMIAAADTEDAIQVLRGGSVHPVAIMRLEDALAIINGMAGTYRVTAVNDAIEALTQARQDIVE